MIETNLAKLFEQLGEASDEKSIARFIAVHGNLPNNMHLHEAPFWSAAQASFLKQAKKQDAAWSQVVDELNVKLHSHQG
ncbi:MAG: DUF2789 family protein [Rhodoferax sp.]|nr:DUF2789 family protein [Rhodoferax sp.]